MEHCRILTHESCGKRMDQLNGGLLLLNNYTCKYWIIRKSTGQNKGLHNEMLLLPIPSKSKQDLKKWEHFTKSSQLWWQMTPIVKTTTRKN